MSETILELLKKEYFRLLRDEKIGKTPDITKKLDEIEKEIANQEKKKNGPRK